MPQSFNPGSKQTEADIAFEMLQAQGRPVYYYTLIEEVLAKLHQTSDPVRISAVLTQINLDARFAYVGNGEWGLKSWVPARNARRLPTITLMNKSVSYDDESEKESFNEVRDGVYGLDREMDEEIPYDREDSYEDEAPNREEEDEEEAEETEEADEKKWV